MQLIILFAEIYVNLAGMLKGLGDYSIFSAWDTGASQRYFDSNLGELKRMKFY